MDTHIKKRRRTEDGDEDAEPVVANSIAKHEVLWFEDGNIVLIAQAVAFRVYRGVLVTASPVFRDLFAVPRSPEMVDFVDGCPTLRLRDRADDLANFLGVLYQGTSTWTNPAEYKTWAVVRAILRLGHKYQIRNLVNAGHSELTRRFPGKLSKWRRRKKYCEGVPSDAVSMANTARILGYHDIHARALYECCQLPADVLVAELSESQDDLRESLCPEDLAAVIEGRETFLRLDYELVFDCFSGSLHPDCHRNRKRVQRSLVSRVRELNRDCLATRQQWIRDICEAHEICDDCITRYLEQYTTACEGVMENLHQFLRIAPDKANDLPIVKPEPRD